MHPTSYHGLSSRRLSLRKAGLDFSRRNFLLLGSAFSLSCLSAIALKQTQLSLTSEIDQDKAEPKLIPALAADEALAIAFWQPEQAITNGFTANLTAASTLRAGDRTFLKRGARIKIQGIYPVDRQAQPGLHSLSANLYYHPTELQDLVKVCIWCATFEPVSSISAATNLQAPVTRSHGLQLSLGLKTDQAAIEVPTQLSVGQEVGVPKLQRGVYLLAARNQQTDDANWEAYQFHPATSSELKSQPQLLRQHRSQNQWVPVEFPYLVMEVDYGAIAPDTVNQA